MFTYECRTSRQASVSIARSWNRSISAVLVEGADYFYADELFVDKASGAVSQVHLAFQAPDRAAVHKFHAAGLVAGGRDNGRPGERRYHPGYYAAFVLDPDGNNIEAVCHGQAARSASSVVVTPAA